MFNRKNRYRVRRLLGLMLVMATAIVSHGASAQTQLISQQSSVVANNIRADAENCATGNTNGTIGHSIRQAMEIHTELASATPNVESLFDAASDCFSGTGQIFDLSFSIPSLASILSAAQDAVLRYAQRRVCTAVDQVTGMVTGPLNQSIDRVGGSGAMGGLNGLSNGLVDQGMTRIDPALGAEYHSARPGGEFNVDANPFNRDQTNFGGGNNGGGNQPNTNTQNPAPAPEEDGNLLDDISDLFNGGGQ